MSQTAYAKRRGVSKMAVSLAIKSGRLKACVVQDQWGNPKIGDPDLADREWDANTDLTKAPAYVKEREAARQAATPGQVAAAAPDAEISLSNAAARVKFWDAELKELKFKEAAGELTPTADVEAQVVEVFSEVKTKILGVPNQLRERDPTLTPAQLELVSSLLREALEALASGADA